MASGRGSDDRNRPSSTQYDNHDYESDHNDSSDPLEENKQTLILVKKFKDTLQARVNDNESITEEDVELATFDARYRLNRNAYDIAKWKEDSSIDIDKDSHGLFQKSMAYAKTPKQVRLIFLAKEEQCQNGTKAQSDKKPPRTSIKNFVKPLKQLNDELEHDSPTNLFAAVLRIPDDQIDRADRLFYIEACRLITDLENYTFENAHDQVQAIRLMHYESTDEKKLRRFIEKCRTFEVAYSYLQQLARERVRDSSQTTTTSHTSKYDDDDPSKKQSVRNTHSSLISSKNPDYNYTSTSRDQNSSSDRSRRGGGATSTQGTTGSGTVHSSAKSNRNNPKS